MPNEIIRYREAIDAIKLAILQSQYRAAKGVNAESFSSIRRRCKPLGVSTCKTPRDMSEDLRALPNINDLKALLEGDA